MLYLQNKKVLAYIVGVALGDGNLSNPNKRAVRLRITCDNKYPGIIKEVSEKIKLVAPKNKVSLIKRKGNCVDISCYSNEWPSVLGWNPGNKIDQNIRIPTWIRNNKTHIKECLKGLFHTDGSIYYDRGFLMVNFVNCAKMLCEDVFSMIKIIGYKPTISILKSSNYQTKYTIRIAQKSKEFIEDIRLIKKPE